MRAHFTAADNSSITGEITHPTHGVLPYTAILGESEDMDRIFNVFLAVPPDPYVPPEPDPAELRAQRDDLIRETDWMILPDSPLADSDKQAVAVYRKALRDVPAQPDFPHAVVWPVLPTRSTK